MTLPPVTKYFYNITPNIIVPFVAFQRSSSNSNIFLVKTIYRNIMSYFPTLIKFNMPLLWHIFCNSTHKKQRDYGLKPEFQHLNIILNYCLSPYKDKTPEIWFYNKCWGTERLSAPTFFKIKRA